MREIHSVELTEDAQIGAARRAVHFFARQQGFSEQALAEIDLAVQEIGTNAVRYATGGGRLHYTTRLDGERGLELFYWDQGPGIYDLDRAVRDGVSTGGSLGGGLGAIGRQMDEFDIYSTIRTTGRLSPSALPQSRTTHGTALLCRKRVAAGETTPKVGRERLGAWSRPCPGEDANGDAYFVRAQEEQTLCAVIDGLGHGPGARQAADVARESLTEWADEPLDEVILAAHQALRATRGAVIGVIVLNYPARLLSYAAVGNIEVRVFEDGEPSPARFVPTNGTLGTRLDKVRVWTHEWRQSPLVVITSDGISARWDLRAYPGLAKKDPQLLAGILMRDYGRDSDDATALVVRARE